MKRLLTSGVTRSLSGKIIRLDRWIYRLRLVMLAAKSVAIEDSASDPCGALSVYHTEDGGRTITIHINGGA